MINEKLKKIKLVITDVDGVLTDGLLHYDANGEAIKSFHVRDGLGVKMLMDAGIQVAVLSGRDSAILRKRISDLGIKLFCGNTCLFHEIQTSTVFLKLA